MIRNWPEIKHDYTFGIIKNGVLFYPDLKELAVIHNVKYQTLRAKAGKDKWKVENLQKSTKIYNDTEKDIVKDISERAAETKVLAYNLIESLLKVSNKLINRLEGEEEGSKDTSDPKTKPMDIKLLMSSAIEGMKAVESIISQKADRRLTDLVDAMESFIDAADK